MLTGYINSILPLSGRLDMPIIPDTPKQNDCYYYNSGANNCTFIVCEAETVTFEEEEE